MKIDELMLLSQKLNLEKEDIVKFLKKYNKNDFEYIIKEIINITKDKKIYIKFYILIESIFNTFINSQLTFEEHVKKQFEDQWLYKEYPNNTINKCEELELSLDLFYEQFYAYRKEDIFKAIDAIYKNKNEFAGQYRDILEVLLSKHKDKIKSFDEIIQEEYNKDGKLNEFLKKNTQEPKELKNNNNYIKELDKNNFTPYAREEKQISILDLQEIINSTNKRLTNIDTSIIHQFISLNKKINELLLTVNSDNKRISNNKEQKQLKFGFYCLLTILSMIFYIIGGLAYLFFDSIMYPTLHAYLASIIIPCVILGIAIGLIYKPIFTKIYRKIKPISKNR